MTKSTILVTGANRGIGLELVKQYAASGCKVLACCRDPEKASELNQLQKNHADISIHQIDVSDEASIRHLADQLKQTPIDILYNNAGVAGGDQQFGSIEYKTLLNTLQVNTVGPVMLAQALIDQVNLGKCKKIVNISSTMGSIELNSGDGWGWLSYRVSKSALNSATRCMANQLKGRQIIVVAMHPGWVQTDMGGAGADISVEKSVSGIKNVISKISLNDSGNFLTYNGKSLPW